MKNITFAVDVDEALASAFLDGKIFLKKFYLLPIMLKTTRRRLPKRKIVIL